MGHSSLAHRAKIAVEATSAQKKALGCSFPTHVELGI